MIDIKAVQQAIKLSQEGDFAGAEALYMKLLEENPGESALLSAIGLFYAGKKDYDKASEYLKKACEIKETLGTVSAFGFAEYERKNFAAAAKILKHALSFGENADIYNKLILSLFEIKNYKEAIEYTEKMNELYPENPKAVANMVKAYTQTGKLLEAEKLCVEYLRKKPDESSLWYHLGLLKELIYSDDKSAIECYKLAEQYGNVASDYNIAVCYQKLGEYKTAENYYKAFLKMFPDNKEAIVSLGMCYLSQKNFNEGYELLYKRKSSVFEKCTNNLWKPKTPLNNELVIICDQGYGDHIQFIRYLPFFKDKRIKIACHDSLKNLFKQNYPDYEFIKYSEINPDTQALRITDLAYVLGMDFDNIPYSEGYLKSESADIKNDKLKVGLCWEAGAAGIRGMINRTINVKCFEPLINKENIQVYSFQYEDTLGGNEKYPRMINLAKDFKDFSDTAAALKSMDIVVSVDTCVAHLSGAMGVKTLLLLPYAPDWRWFRGADAESKTLGVTPWYDSVNIIMQKDGISWEEPINKVIEVINDLITSHKSS